jgi:SAM-dependent methyltransferase
VGPTSLPQTSTRRILDRALEMLQGAAPEPGILADVPCGTGYLSVRAAQQGWKVTPLDIDPSLWEGGSLAAPTAVDLNQPLRLPDQSFDAIVSCEGIEHLENPWLALRELRRVLRADGVLVVSIPNTIDLRQRLRVLRWGAYGHYYPLQLGHINLMGTIALCHALLHGGFEIEAIDVPKVYGGPVRRLFSRLFRVSGRTKLPADVRRMLSSPRVLCARTIVVAARKVG